MWSLPLCPKVNEGWFVKITVTSLLTQGLSAGPSWGCPCVAACVLASTSVISKLSPSPMPTLTQGTAPPSPSSPHLPSCFLQLSPASQKYTSSEPHAIFPARSPDTLGGPVAPPPPPLEPSQGTHSSRPTAADGAALWSQESTPRPVWAPRPRVMG